jgi:hypothetical protein
MSTLSRNARIAGLFYLAVVLLGPIRLIYIPSALFATGNAAATAHNIVSHEHLFRVGIYADLLCATIEIFVLLALYRLLNGVDRALATIMVVLGIADVPIYFVNTLNDFAALLFARGADFLLAFGHSQRDAMVMLYLNLHHYGAVVNEVFWGLWLLPFGILVYKSGFLPRILGIWLVLNGMAYLAENFTGVLLPQYANIVGNLAFPLELGEVAIMLWLIVMGAKDRSIMTPIKSS